MNVSLRCSRSCLVVSVEGRFDAHSASLARAAIEVRMQERASDVFIDLRACTFIDSAGVNLLIHLLKRAVACGRTLHMFGIHGQPKHLIEFLRLDRAIPAVDSLPESYA